MFQDIKICHNAFFSGPRQLGGFEAGKDESRTATQTADDQIPES